MKKISLNAFYLISSILFLSSCQDQNRIFERNEEFPKGEWQRQNHPTFEFKITDTTQTYNVLYNVRNTMDYEFSNIYMNYILEDSVGNTLYQNQLQAFLFDQAGKPTGEKSFFFSLAVADIYDHYYLCLSHIKFEKSGTYRLKLKQYMRNQDPLKNILAVGVRIEKAR